MTPTGGPFCKLQRSRLTSARFRLTAANIQATFRSPVLSWRGCKSHQRGAGSKQCMSIPSTDQARQVLLSLSLAQLAIQQHKLDLEMANIREMRLQLRNAMLFRKTTYA
jgi:hypothetical protein